MTIDHYLMAILQKFHFFLKNLHIISVSFNKLAYFTLPMADRCRTPVDDPKILEEWKELHRHNTEELGMSKRQSYYQIGKQYGGCSWTTPQYWLKPSVRDASIKRLKANRIPYSKNPRIEERRLHSRLYQNIRRNIHCFLREIYCSQEEALSLETITDCLYKLSGVKIRNKTLLKIVSLHEQKYGKKLLVENRTYEPPKYKLHISSSQNYARG